MVTCFILSFIRVIQDLDERNLHVYVNVATTRVMKISTKPSTITPGGIIPHVNRDNRTKLSKLDNVTILDKINKNDGQQYKGKMDQRNNMKHFSLDIGQKEKVRGTIKNVTKKPVVKLLPFSRFSYPIEMDLQQEIEKITKGTPSNVTHINPHSYIYMHGDYDFCKSLSPNFSKDNNELFLLILVKSTASHFQRRKSIRLSWNNHTYYKHVNFKTLFMLGHNESLKNEIKLESSKYGDLIQENFEDGYLNNTLKMIMGFNWAVKYCKNARYIFFVDDDYFVNVGNLASYLSKLKLTEEQKYIGGYLLPRSVPYRDNMTKWYITLEDYPFDRWPPYLAGGAFVTSMYVARKFQLAFPFVKYMGIDDCYLGIVAKKLKMKLHHNFKFCYRPCKFSLKTTFCSHGFGSSEDMIGAWKNQLYDKIVYQFKANAPVVRKRKV